ncbi:MAG: GHKL domain-containing protein [Treponema sp.]|nr:GHKL domain-containing protein [Treponema sp.]
MFSLIRWLYEKQIVEDHERLIANHVQEVQNLYLTMRGWRHDYHNHLQTIKAFLAMGDYDNAIESCEKLSVSSDRFVRVYIGTLKQQLYICCTNATTELVRRLDSQYISLKRGNHGHRLKRIDAVVKKYGGYINRKNEPGVFSTEILLPL